MKKTLICALMAIFFLAGCSGNLNQKDDNANQQEKQGAPLNAVHEQDSDKENESLEKEIISIETPLLDKRSNRLKNINLAAQSINSIIIEKGQEFSFNETVGKRTIDNGYKEAVVFVENKKEKEVGGGICQLSSTIYAAAKYAGLEITERHEHQLPVDYIKQGDDAAVYYGELDMKFKNNTQHSVRIYISVGKESLVVTLSQA